MIKLELVKDASGITASNEEAGTIDCFEETEDGRKEFIRYFLEEFINREIE